MIPVGFHSKERADDASTITALGSTPADAGDPDKIAKDAIRRVELQVFGRGAKFGLDKVYRALDETWPTTYDTWTMGQGRTLLMVVNSFKISDGSVIPFGDVANGTWDATIDARADAVIAAKPAGKLWLCYAHEPAQDGGYQTQTTAFRGAGATNVPVNAIPIAIPDGHPLTFANGVTSTVNNPGGYGVGATSITCTALSGSVNSGTKLYLQTAPQARADHKAAWQRFFDRAAARPGWSATGIKRVPVYLHNAGFWDPGEGADQLYPGSDYVDYLGWDGAYSTPSSWVEFQFRFETGGFLAWARSKGKMMVVGETGVNEDPGDPDRAPNWFINAATFLRTLPDMAAWCYFTGASNGFYLDTSPEGSALKLSTFARLFNDSYFLNLADDVTEAHRRPLATAARLPRV